MFRSQEKNYMQLNQLNILTTLRNAMKRQSSHEFDVANVQYMDKYVDPDTKLKTTGGIEVTLDFYPNGRTQGGNAIDPIKIPFTYPLAYIPTLDQLYRHINEDFAMFKLANKYPGLKIRGTSTTNRYIQVANPFSAESHLQVNVLDDCLNLCAGTFDVKKYAEDANEIIINKMKASAGVHAGFHMVNDILVVWDTSKIASLGVTVLLPHYVELELDEEASKDISLLK